MLAARLRPSVSASCVCLICLPYVSVLKCVRQDRHQYICLPYMPLYACLRCLCAAGPAPIYVPALYASMCLPYVSVCGRTGTNICACFICLYVPALCVCVRQDRHRLRHGQAHRLPRGGRPRVHPINCNKPGEQSAAARAPAGRKGLVSRAIPGADAALAANVQRRPALSGPGLTQ